jgi:hypothetical protein
MVLRISYSIQRLRLRREGLGWAGLFPSTYLMTETYPVSESARLIQGTQDDGQSQLHANNGLLWT